METEQDVSLIRGGVESPFDERLFYAEEPLDYSYDNSFEDSDIQEDHLSTIQEALWDSQTYREYGRPKTERGRKWLDNKLGLFCDMGNLNSCRNREPTPNKNTTHRERYTIVPTYQSYEYE